VPVELTFLLISLSTLQGRDLLEKNRAYYLLACLNIAEKLQITGLVELFHQAHTEGWGNASCYTFNIWKGSRWSVVEYCILL